MLEGSVRRASGKVRVNAQLIDARTDAHLWAETYDRDVADVFAIQSEIAKRSLISFEAKLSPSEKAQSKRRPPGTSPRMTFMCAAKLLNDSFPSAPADGEAGGGSGFARSGCGARPGVFPRSLFIGAIRMG